MNTDKTINAKRVLSLITALFLCTSLIFLTGCKKKEKSEGSDEKSYYATLNKTIMPADKIKDLPALFKAIKKEAKEHKLSLESYSPWRGRRTRRHPSTTTEESAPSMTENQTPQGESATPFR